jgi:hypothetical protein
MEGEFMSAITHITKTQMVEREFLTKALEDLGYAWEEGGSVTRFGPKLDIKIKGQLAGFKKSGGGYDFVARGRRRKVQRDVQQDLKKIIQRYIYHAACAKLQAQGFTLAREEVRESGQIHLVLRRMA